MAKRYLSAKELGISKDARAALIKTCNMLADGRIKYKAGDKFKSDLYRDDPDRGKKKFFNMDIWESEYDCGTAACIGGWMGHFGWDGERESADALSSLFYDYPTTEADERGRWREDRITNKQAAKVGFHFLRTGEIDWSVRTKRS